MSSRDHGWMRLPGGDSELTLSLPQVGLRPGTYRVKLSLSTGAMHDILGTRPIAVLDHKGTAEVGHRFALLE